MRCRRCGAKPTREANRAAPRQREPLHVLRFFSLGFYYFFYDLHLVEGDSDPDQD